MAQKTAPEVVVITGASAGIGRSIAQAFARRGAHVGLIARGLAGLEGVRREVEQLGGKAIALSLDVADAEAVDQAASRVEETFGPIDIWVNDAFTSIFSEFKDISPEDYKRVTEVSYLGYVHGTMAALKRMLPRDHGRIIQVGSALSYRSIPLQSAYCGAKHAINGFTDSIRTELIHNKSNVRISVAQMPAVNTPQFTWVKSKLPRKAQPVPPIYQPEVAGEAVYWLAHHYKREMFVGLSTAIVITGNKIAPWLGGLYLGRTGYKSQQYDGARDSNAPFNLYEPVDNNQDYGAHGSFDKRATNKSYEVWVSEHMPSPEAMSMALLAAAALTVSAFGALGILGRAVAGRSR